MSNFTSSLKVPKNIRNKNSDVMFVCAEPVLPSYPVHEFSVSDFLSKTAAWGVAHRSATGSSAAYNSPDEELCTAVDHLLKAERSLVAHAYGTVYSGYTHVL